MRLVRRRSRLLASVRLIGLSECSPEATTNRDSVVRGSACWPSAPPRTGTGEGPHAARKLAGAKGRPHFAIGRCADLQPRLVAAHGEPPSTASTRTSPPRLH